MARMSEQDLELFNDSLERCMASSGFLDRFYELFLASSEEVSEKFKDTDFRRQKRMLRASLYLMIAAFSGEPRAQAELEQRAEFHSRRQRDIRPELYDLWLECLIRAVKEFDRKFTDETERVWRKVMRQGIELMIAKY